ncbi:MAG: hypothetical protein DRP59_07885 [Spirochaetes bacterium]|nr:MAG: hypothetical protein DRP59_07885 [Spirochaetota bacterium]
MLNNLEQWKTIVLSLPDDDFFGIMRNYLGKIKTPFNKHILVDRLIAFLTREETIDRITALISSEDAYILTLIYFLDEPDIKTLYEFLKDNTSFLEVQHRLLNLEERLLTIKEPGTERIRLSPIFKEPLVKQVLNTNLIFPSKKVGTEKIPFPWFNEAVITAVFSFINQTPDIFKLDGSIKKRPRESLLQIFPSILEEVEKGVTKFSVITESLIHLNLLTNERGRLLIKYRNLKEFSSLDSNARCPLLWSTAVCGGEDMATLIRVSGIISTFLNSIPVGTGFSKSNLLFLLKAASREQGLFEMIKERVIPALTHREVFLKYDNDLYLLNPMVKEMISDEPKKEPALIIQSSFSITAKPWTTLQSGLLLALSSTIKSFDLFAHYEINKKSCVGIRKLKLTYTDLLLYFKNEGGTGIPQNIETSLKHWAEEYSTVHLYKGIALIVSESRQVLIDHIGALEPYIKLHPAPGVYLFDENEQAEWIKILQDEGIPILSDVKMYSSETEETGIFEAVQGETANQPKLNFINNNGSSVKADNSFIEDLKYTLEKKNFTVKEKKELQARINKKLILFPEQLQKGIYRKEIVEVRGLDYTGKIRLIHRAMESQTDILEIKSYSLPKGKRRILVKPARIQNDSNKHLLIAHTLPEEKEVEIPVGKISYVRLLKSSLYNPVTRN